MPRLSVPTRSIAALLLALYALAAQAAPTPAPAMLIRFPNAGADAIAFVAGGNLWTVPLGGGQARRLTDDPGQVFAPHYSPDGRHIAFTWRKGYTSDVYVVAAAGGTPVQLTYGPTYESYDNLVTGWSGDGREVLFLSQRRSAFRGYDLYRVNADGGLPAPFGLGSIGLADVSADGDRIVYDWSLRNFGRDRWKRYYGGQAGELFRYDRATGASVRLTDWKGTDTAPMQVGDRLYFLSDRGRESRLNLWSADADGRDARQLTRYADYDVDLPSKGAGGIAYAQGGRLYRFDTAAQAATEVAVAFAPDALPKAREREVGRFLRRTDIARLPDYAIAPDGARAYGVARGDIFAFGTDRAAHNLTATPDASEDHPSVSPDGRWLALTTDANGTEQVALMPVGGGRRRILSALPSTALFQPRWSPDGTRLAVADGNKRLWLLDAASGREQLIAQDRYAEIHDAAFSPDSRLLAYSTTDARGMRGLHVRDLQTGVDTAVPARFSSDHDPAFSGDGRLIFVSSRREFPFVSDRDREGTVASVASDGVYAAPLQFQGRFDPAGASARAQPLAVAASAGYASLQVRGDRLFYRATPVDTLGPDLPGQTGSLHVLDLRSGQDREASADGGAYALTPDGEHALLARSGGWKIVATADRSERALKTDGLRMTVDPRMDARTMFDQAWRLSRDLFWDRSMNGVDWDGVRARYARLAPQAASYEDLVYLIGELQGELSTSHMFVGGGDSGDPRRDPDAAQLGADLAWDPTSGAYVLSAILRGDPSRPNLRAPLGDPALDVREGDRVLAIDGHALRPDQDPYRWLRGTAEGATLTLSRGADGAPREIRVVPVEDERELRKAQWIEHNRARVAQLSGDRYGYVYLSDFEANGAADFLLQFYAQTDKQGIVVDVRDNLGGFTSQWVLGLLRRPQAGFFRNREGGASALPGALAPALAVVVNRFSMSDGDQFPYFFKQWRMGPVVGQRTWGGVRGIRGPWTLMSGIQISVPKDSLLAADGSAIIENQGAVPDIVVDDTPADVRDGRDRQLEAAVRALAGSSRRDPAEHRAP